MKTSWVRCSVCNEITEVTSDAFMETMKGRDVPGDRLFIPKSVAEGDAVPVLRKSTRSVSQYVHLLSLIEKREVSEKEASEFIAGYEKWLDRSQGGHS